MCFSSIASLLHEDSARYSVRRCRRTDELKQRIETAIPGARAEVTDLTGGGDHFRAVVVAPAFAGL